MYPSALPSPLRRGELGRILHLLLVQGLVPVVRSHRPCGVLKCYCCSSSCCYCFYYCFLLFLLLEATPIQGRMWLIGGRNEAEYLELIRSCFQATALFGSAPFQVTPLPHSPPWSPSSAMRRRRRGRRWWRTARRRRGSRVSPVEKVIRMGENRDARPQRVIVFSKVTQESIIGATISSPWKV